MSYDVTNSNSQQYTYIYYLDDIKPLILSKDHSQTRLVSKMASTQIDTMKSLLEELKKETSWATSKTALLCEKMDAAFWKCQDKEEFTQVFCDCGGPGKKRIFIYSRHN